MTDEQLKEYADKLPQIYKDILLAFAQMYHGYLDNCNDIAIPSLAVHFRNMEGEEWSQAEIKLAVDNMIKAGFVKITNEFFVHLLEMGKKMTAALMPEPPKVRTIPPLPPLPE